MNNFDRICHYFCLMVEAVAVLIQSVVLGALLIFFLPVWVPYWLYDFVAVKGAERYRLNKKELKT